MVDPEGGAWRATRRTRGFAWASLVLASLTTIVLVMEDRAGLLWPHRDVESYEDLLAVLLLCGASLRVAALATGAFALVRLSQPPRHARHIAVAVCGVVGATMADSAVRVALCVCVAVAFPYLPGVARLLLVVVKRVTAMCKMEEPRVSRMAIASLMLGGIALIVTLILHAFSALSLGDTYGHFEFDMWLMLGAMPLSPLAVVLGSVAIVQIRQQPGRLRGMTLAVGGTASGAVTLMWGFGFLMLVYVLVALSPVAGAVALVLWLKRRGERARAVSGAPTQLEEEAEPPAMPARRVPISGVAVAALVLGLLTFPTFGLAGLPGIIVGLVALVSIGLSRGRVRGIGLALAGIVLSAACLALVVYPMFMREKVGAQKAVCLSNVKNLTLALQMYLEDNDNTFPALANWCEALQPYVKNEAVFRCPAAKDRDLACAYAYNAALSSLMYDALADPASTIAIFESDAGWNASGGPELLPEKPRHLAGDNLGFADGHVAWFHRERLLSEESQVRWQVE